MRLLQWENVCLCMCVYVCVCLQLAVTRLFVFQHRAGCAALGVEMTACCPSLISLHVASYMCRSEGSHQDIPVPHAGLHVSGPPTT